MQEISSRYAQLSELHVLALVAALRRGNPTAGISPSCPRFPAWNGGNPVGRIAPALSLPMSISFGVTDSEYIWLLGYLRDSVLSFGNV